MSYRRFEDWKCIIPELGIYGTTGRLKIGIEEGVHVEHSKALDLGASSELLSSANLQTFERHRAAQHCCFFDSVRIHRYCMKWGCWTLSAWFVLDSRVSSLSLQDSVPDGLGDPIVCLENCK